MKKVKCGCERLTFSLKRNSRRVCPVLGVITPRCQVVLAWRIKLCEMMKLIPPKLPNQGTGGEFSVKISGGEEPRILNEM